MRDTSLSIHPSAGAPAISFTGFIAEEIPLVVQHELEDVWADVFGIDPSAFVAGSPPDSAERCKMKASDIVATLTRFYMRRNKPNLESWVVFPELYEGTRYGYRQRIDLWAMCLWQSLGMDRISYEIKVSRSDLLAELRNPRKREFALSVSNRFYFATPPRLMSLPEVPPEAGLVECWPDGKVHFRKGAPRRELSPSIDMQFAASVFRRAFRHMGSETEDTIKATSTSPKVDHEEVA